MASFKTILFESIDYNNTQWSFHVPGLPSSAKTNPAGLVKLLSVVSNDKRQIVELGFVKCPSNRVVSADPLDKFILISFSDFRLRVPCKADDRRTEPATGRESAEYVTQLLSNGICINNVTYNFYGHSNSQLKSRSCFLFAAAKDQVATKIEQLGDFSKIKTVAKKAKRIGLLFSTADVGVLLPTDRCEDIPDIQNKDYNFTDGCGLISVSLAKQLVKKINITFRNHKYTPSVFQIRYRGYKGVLMLEPALCGRILVQFRDSMRKFKDAADLTLSVVEFSKPYSYGYLNDETILLLSALGLTSETLVRKQHEYLTFLAGVQALDPRQTFQYLCSFNHFEMAEKLLFDGLESVQARVRKMVKEEHTKLLNKRGQQRSRILIQQSRLLFGVCDPYDVLREGQCFVRLTMEGDGCAKTLTGADVLVTRNPCLHPGDMQKFRLAQREELSHLVDCIVFSTRGNRPSADMMSGGDLDGDKFFVCWDKDVVPSIMSEPAQYPAPKESITFRGVTDEDRIKYFAQYSSMSLGQIKNLYLDWAKYKGSMSSECQELNRLFSQCVDGNRVKIPEKLQTLPLSSGDEAPFILDVLHEAAGQFLAKNASNMSFPELLSLDGLELLLSHSHLPLSEFELIQLTMRWCCKNEYDFNDLLSFFDFNLLSDEQKGWVASSVITRPTEFSMVTNGLVQSSILSPVELKEFRLDHPGLHWKRIFDSQEARMASFLDRTARVLELFHKKLLVLKLDDRISFAIYIPKKLNRQKDCYVGETVRVFAIPHTHEVKKSLHKVVPTKTNYRLYCDSNVFQLFDLKRGNTWIFLQKGPKDDTSYRHMKNAGDRRRQKELTFDLGINHECRASIALDKISRGIKDHIGRVNRQGVLDAEIFVISNRNVGALRTLDLWLEFVDTQERLPLFDQVPRHYVAPDIAAVDWSKEPSYVTAIARDGELDQLESISSERNLNDLLSWLLNHRQSRMILRIYTRLLDDSSNGEVLRSTTVACLLEFLPDAPYAAETLFRSKSWPFVKRQIQDNLPRILFCTLKNILLLATSIQEMILRPLAALIDQVEQVTFDELSELVGLVALVSPSMDLGLDMLLGHLQLLPSRLKNMEPAVTDYSFRMLSGIALDHLDQSLESASIHEELLTLKYLRKDASYTIVECAMRVDAPLAITLRMGDHIKLKTASSPENRPLDRPFIIDALVEKTEKGMGTFRCLQDVPSYLEECSWKMKHCGSFTTSETMLDAISFLVVGRSRYCGIFPAITGAPKESMGTIAKLQYETNEALNESQQQAVDAAMSSELTLLWGPPGTGKTRTVVEILQKLLKAEQAKRILVTAPTHNAVDNILRKFLELLPCCDKSGYDPIRVSTDVRKVSEDLKMYTCDAMMGKDLNTNHDARRKAQKRIKKTRLVFTTCIGANLGLLRGEQFEIVLVDEASQQTEPTCLVPLVKGCKRAVLVGDHVQLRATCGQHAQAVGFDISLFERLYTAQESPLVRKVMLDTQYRMHRDICSFSSTEFYAAALKTAVFDSSRELEPSLFSWPQSLSDPTKTDRMLFIQCSHPEDLGRKSKSNIGQANLCRDIYKLLTTAPKLAPIITTSAITDTTTITTTTTTTSNNDRPSSSTSVPPTDRTPRQTITILTPYTRQLTLLKTILPSAAELHTIDSFQGREADIIIFVTVRCNQRAEMGFLRDMRRLNVAMTRARKGVVIVGDEATLVGKGNWKRAVDSCLTRGAGAGEGEQEEEEEKEREVWRRLIAGCRKILLEEKVEAASK